MASTQSSAPGAALVSNQASSVSSFIGSIGVGAHIDSGNAQWTNSPLLLQELSYLGVSNVRDGAPFDYSLPTFITLARAGIRFNLLEANVYSFNQHGQVNAALDVFRAHQLELAAPGSVLSFEGANEYTTNAYVLNGRPSSGDLLWGVADVAALQSAVRLDALFARTPVIASSAIELDSLPNFSTFVDGSNAHVYGDVGEQLQDRIINSVHFAQASAPGKPVYVTEVGISSAGFGASTWGVANEAVQAIVDINALLDGYAARASKTFLYELMDEPDAANLQEQHFGLFHADGAPKPAATAIGNLTHILHDGGRSEIPAGSLTYSLTGLPSTASSMLLQKSDGVYDLVLWNGRAELFNGTQEVTPPTSNVTLTLGATASAIEVYDPMQGVAPLGSSVHASTVSFGLSAGPIIVQVTLPGAVALASPAAAALVSGDSVQGGAGDDTISGSGASTYLRGGDGNDLIQGGPGFDNINGNVGNDTAHGGDGNDWVLGGKDNDVLTGDNGDDIVYGNIGNDTISGDAGNDVVRGGQNDDSLSGGAGDDWLSGDRGNDTITGGSGADIFHTFSGAGIDRVLDFKVSEGDRVQVDVGTAYTINQVGSDTVVDMGNGDQLILVEVAASTLTSGWIFTA